MPMSDKSCFSCKHGHIVETSYEWIECHCPIDGKWQSPFKWTACPNWEPPTTDNTKEEEE